MAAHVLGNGPSLTQTFKRNDWPETDTFIGCNFSDEALRPNYTIMIDVRPMRLFGEKGYRIRIPTYISDKAQEYITNDLGQGGFRDEWINKAGVIPLIHWTEISKKTAMNSGHHAAMHAISNGHKTIHIWGIDSLWQDDLISLTDVYTRPTSTAARIEVERATIWRTYWLEIFRRHPDCQFIIHQPPEATTHLDLRGLENTAID